MTKVIVLTATKLERINYRSDDTVSFVNGGLIDPKAIESELDNIIYSTSDGNIWLKPAGLESSPINLSQVVLNETQLDNINKISTIEKKLDNKVDKKEGFSLSKNDFTDDLVAKLKGIEDGAQKNLLTQEQATTLLGLIEKVANLETVTAAVKEWVCQVNMPTLGLEFRFIGSHEMPKETLPDIILWFNRRSFAEWNNIFYPASGYKSGDGAIVGVQRSNDENLIIQFIKNDGLMSTMKISNTETTTIQTLDLAADWTKKNE